MKVKEVYILKVEDADKFILRTTKHFHIFEVFGNQCRMRTNKVVSAVKLYFYVTKDGDKVISVVGGAQDRFEFSTVDSFDLVKAYKERKLKTPKEGRSMFTNFKITSIDFREVNDVALEAAIEKVAATMDGVEIKTKGDKSYLVKDGSAIELNGKEFQELVAKYVVGKTEADLTRNAPMYQLIKSLGIIKKATVEADESDLSTIFG